MVVLCSARLNRWNIQYYHHKILIMAKRMTASASHLAADDDQSSCESLGALAEQTRNLLMNASPHSVDCVPKEMHPLPPFIPKSHWTRLGQAIRIAENPTCASIPGNYWISLRCDGTGFSKFIKSMERRNIMESGWSPTLASIMKKCCQELMSKFSAKCGFTQSDELTILLPPSTKLDDNGEYHLHQHGGRVQKLCSLAAANVTACFNQQLVRLFRKHGIQQENDHGQEGDEGDDPGIYATFDCRVGMYETEVQAMSLILWRSYDCSVNSVSDAVFRLKGTIAGAGAMVKQRTDQKLQWLHQHSQLPLAPHQREGCYFVRVKRVITTINPVTNQPVTCLRSKIEHVEGNVLILFKNNQMIPPDEELEESGSS
ncbi:hypothetical protein ACA910_005811 [Epithemia clementina (nom. ined.)]